MKKRVIAVLIAVLTVAGAASASAMCGFCPNEYCVNAGYCVEECPNNCTPRHNGMGAHRRAGRTGHHRGCYCGDNAYCQYR